MNALLRCCVVAGLMAGVFLSSAAITVGGDHDKGVLSQAPQEEPRLKVGSTLTIAGEGANLMVGKKVVATVPKGQRIVVVDVRDSWVGTYVSVNGRRMAGWIGTAHFIPAGSPAKSEPQIFTAASKPIASEPAQDAVAVRVRRPASSNSGDNYFRDYHIGYYERHETDPNIHVWEPWRYNR